MGLVRGAKGLNIEQKGKSGRVNGTVKRLVNTSTYRVRRRHAGMQACRHAATQYRHANCRDTQHAARHARTHVSPRRVVGERRLIKRWWDRRNRVLAAFRVPKAPRSYS